jgi:aspartyl/asparaginyl beta-hydroxylase (cupin superfamily)
MSTNSFLIWQQGVNLWYNGDYLQAMAAWKTLVDNNDDDDEERLDDDEDPVAFFQKHSEESPLAPLLLFLAGCQLDAGDYIQSRQTLRQCLLACSNDALRQRALSEYISAYQEDSSVDSSKIAYTILNYTIQNFSCKWTDPYQRAGFLYPSISSRPFYDEPEHPSWCGVLEEHYPVIRDELHRLTDWECVGHNSQRDGAGAHDASVVHSGDWHEIVLFGSGEQPQLAPVTSQLFYQHVPQAVSLARAGGGEVVFSRLAPQTHIGAHCGTTNVRLTAHLGLVIPSKGTRIRVGNEWRTWQAGKVLILDDSYEHEVLNESDEERIVLLIRFWHWNLPTEDRDKALEQALQAKQEDEDQRYHPPSPPY